MAKCEHGFEPSHQCGICSKERNYLQFGGVWSGELGLKYKGNPTTKLGMKEAMEERAADYDPEKQEAAMKEFILKSFTTEVEVPKVKEDE